MKRTACFLLGSCLLGSLLLPGEAHAQSLWKKKSATYNAIQQKAVVAPLLSFYDQLCNELTAVSKAKKTTGVSTSDTCDAVIATSVVIANDMAEFGGAVFQANVMRLLQTIASGTLTGKDLALAIALRIGVFEKVYKQDPAKIKSMASLVAQEPQIVSAAYGVEGIDVTPMTIKLSGLVPAIWSNKTQMLAALKAIATDDFTEVPSGSGATPVPDAVPKGDQQPKKGDAGTGDTTACVESKFKDGPGAPQPAPSDPSPAAMKGGVAMSGGFGGGGGSLGGMPSKGAEVPTYMNEACANYGLYKQIFAAGKPPSYADIRLKPLSGAQPISKFYENPQNKTVGEAIAKGNNGDGSWKQGNSLHATVNVFKNKGGTNSIVILGQSEPLDGQFKVGTTKKNPPKAGATVTVSDGTSTVTVTLQPTEKKEEEKKKEKEKEKETPSAPTGTGQKYDPEGEGDIAACNKAMDALLSCLDSGEGGGECNAESKVTSVDKAEGDGAVGDVKVGSCASSEEQEKKCKEKIGPVAGGVGMPTPDGGGVSGLCEKGGAAGIPVIAQEWIIDWGPEGKPGGEPKGKECEAAIACTQTMCPEGTQCVAIPSPVGCAAVCKPKGKAPAQGP